MNLNIIVNIADADTTHSPAAAQCSTFISSKSPPGVKIF